MNTPTCAPRFSHWLIARAARAAPAPLRERLAEEWLADLQARRSALSQLCFALGCCWATRVIALEGVTAAAAPAGASGGGVKLAFADIGRGARWFSRRSLALLTVVALHVALVYALMHGLGETIVKHLTAPLLYHPITEPEHPDVLPPLRPPVVATHRWKGPPIDEVRIPPEIVVGPDDPPSETGTDSSAPPPIAARVLGGPGNGFPNPDDYYPSIAKTSNEQGVATVNVCVDAHGRLTADPTIVAGTSSKRLDAGALLLARAGSGHYRPTLEDGRPIASCYSFRVRFRLDN